MGFDSRCFLCSMTIKLLLSSLFVFAFFTGVAQVENPDSSTHSEPASLYDSTTTDDDIIDGTSLIPARIQLRVSTVLSSQRAFYNTSWNRVDNAARTSNLTLTVQGYFQVMPRMDVGLIFAARSLAIGSFDSSPLNAISIKENNHLRFYLRSSSLIVKYLLFEKKYRVMLQSIYLHPLEKTVELSYKETSVRDLLTPLWTNQVTCSRRYSANFILIASPIILQTRFNNETSDRQVSVRSSITPQFNYYFIPQINFFAFSELNLLLYNESSSGFFFREGLGMTFITNKNITFNAAYSYNALGRKTNALNTFILSGRYNF